MSKLLENRESEVETVYGQSTRSFLRRKANSGISERFVSQKKIDIVIIILRQKGNRGDEIQILALLALVHAISERGGSLASFDSVFPRPRYRKLAFKVRRGIE